MLPLRSGFGANLTGGIDGTLLLDGIGQVRDGQAKFRQLVWLNPDAHGIIGGPEVRDLPNPGNTQKRIVNIDCRVVAQELPAVGIVWRVNRKDKEGETH